MKPAAGAAAKPTLVGTPNYMCPEVITASTDLGPFGSQDIWSVGCVVLEMRSGKRPWHHLDNEWAIMYQIGIGSRHPPLPELAGSNDPPGSFTISAAGLDFLECCFRPAANRPAAVHLLQHGFFSDMQSKLADYRRRFPEQKQPFPNPWSSLAGFAKGLHSPGFSPSISALLNRRTSYFSRSVNLNQPTIKD
jgi:mitogen-activated protein kinase kinase kinase